MKWATDIIKEKKRKRITFIKVFKQKEKSFFSLSSDRFQWFDLVPQHKILNCIHPQGPCHGAVPTEHSYTTLVQKALGHGFLFNTWKFLTRKLKSNEEGDQENFTHSRHNPRKLAAHCISQILCHYNSQHLLPYLPAHTGRFSI